MNKWNGKERRKHFMKIEELRDEIRSFKGELKIDIALLINTVQGMKDFMNRQEQMLTKHDKTIYGNGSEGLTSKVNSFESIRTDLKEHCINDRNSFIGIYTLMISIILGMVKVIFFR